MLYGIDLPEGKVTGSVYLHDQWQRMSIKIFTRDEAVPNILSRYNLFTNQLEVSHNGQQLALNTKAIAEFFWVTDAETVLFRNTFLFGDSSQTKSSFLQVLVDDELKLLKETRLKIKKPDYSIQLNVGSKDTRITQEVRFHWFYTDLREIQSRKKTDLATAANISSERLNEFIRSEHLVLTHESDLVRLFTWLNQQKERGL
jgi:hypothetical protein